MGQPSSILRSTCIFYPQSVPSFQTLMPTLLGIRNDAHVFNRNACVVNVEWLLRRQATLSRLRCRPLLSLLSQHLSDQKVKLGNDATPADVLEHLRNAAASGEGVAGVSEELEALMTDPLEVSVEKSVRKGVVDVAAGKGRASFEVTGL